MKNTRKVISVNIIAILLILLPAFTTRAQQLVDEIVAVVGQNMILESHLESQYLQMRAQGGIRGSASAVKCEILENMMFEKLLLNQAELDSIVVTEPEVEQELNQRLRYFTAQFGSQEKLEEFYGKSIIEIKEEFRELVRNMLLVNRVQQDITANVVVTPSEVKEYFRNIPADSVEFINAQVEIAQVVKMPVISMEQKRQVKERLRELRRRITEGESFATLAILYSEDPGSASKGGELGFYGRGELFPEFEAVAFKLEAGEISDIVETEAGFHIIQMIERKGEYINVRHILLRTKVSPVDLAEAKQELDSIALLIRNDSITFDEAVARFSDDPGKSSQGMLVNPMTSATRFEMDELEPQVSFVIDKLEPGEISNAVPMKTKDGRDAYRILMLKSRTKPHRANLKDDYNRIAETALQAKKTEKVNEWVVSNLENAYLRISDRYRDCEFMHDWISASD